MCFVCCFVMVTSLLCLVCCLGFDLRCDSDVVVVLWCLRVVCYLFYSLCLHLLWLTIYRCWLALFALFVLMCFLFCECLIVVVLVYVSVVGFTIALFDLLLCYLLSCIEVLFFVWLRFL